MKKEEFFKKLNNPLDNDELLRIILEAYYNDESIYRTLISTNATKEDKTISYYNIEERNKLHLYLFNIWKDSILKYNPKNIKKEYYEPLLNVKRELKKFNPTTEKEIRRFVFNIDKIFDTETEEFLDKFSYIAQGNYTGWTHISNKYITFFNDEIPKIKHRLYVNVNSTYIDKFARLFTEKCREENLPFYYKYDEYGDRSDTFIVFSDTKNLFKYINILERIKKENLKEVKENIKTPPILTAKLNNWIGYGSEPQLKEKNSYTKLREESIVKVLDKFNKNWTNSHKDKFVDVKGNKIPYKVFFAELLYDTYIKTFNNKIKNTKEEQLDKVIPYCGYSLNDTKTDGFRKALKENIYRNIDYIIENIDDVSKIDKNKLIKMNTRIKDSYFQISTYQIKKALKRQPMILSRDSKVFYNQFRNAIKKDAKRYNISDENYCFDKKVLEELKNFITIKEEKEKTIKKEKNNTSKQKAKKAKVKENTNKKEIKIEEPKQIVKVEETKDKKQVKNLEINEKLFHRPNENGIYRLRKEQISQDLPINFKGEDTRFNHGMSDKEIEEARKRIALPQATTYEKPHIEVKPKKVKVPEEELEIKGIVLNGDIYLNGNINITINNYPKSKTKTMRITR